MEKRRPMAWDTVNLVAVAWPRGPPASTICFAFPTSTCACAEAESRSSRYKKVSWAGNGKRAKKTIWTQEGIWRLADGLGPPGTPTAPCQPSMARGHARKGPRWRGITLWYHPLAPFKRTPGTQAGNSSWCAFQKLSIAVWKVKDIIRVIITLARIYMV